MIVIEQLTHKFFIFVIVLLLCFFAWSCYMVFTIENAAVYKENGIIENIQVLILCITFFIFLAPPFYQKRNDKLISLFFSLLIVNFILRELDVEKFDIPKVLILIGSGVGRKVLLAIGFVSILLYAAFDIKHYLHLSLKLLQSRTGILILIAPIFLFMGGFFEDAQFPHHEYFEEMSELIGYVFLLFAATILFYQPLGHRYQYDKICRKNT